MSKTTGVENKKITIRDAYWAEIIGLVQDTVIPYQWRALNDDVPGAEPSHAVRNFRVAAGLEKGEFGGMVFQDSDLAKWIEAAANSLKLRPDNILEKQIDDLIDVMDKAQHEDGYLNTYFTLKRPDGRWKDLLNCHELYCAGHMIEAAVAYREATGKDSLLKIMRRYADYIGQVFGPEPGKLRGYPGHPEIELALVRLYEATGVKKYLDLAYFFIDERGREPSYFDMEWARNGSVSFWTGAHSEHPNPEHGGTDYREYNQFHKPVREQHTAVGHAVRALYLYAGMAAVAAHTRDAALIAACKSLWNNVTNRQMYVTGGVGSTVVGEAFTFDYDLPNDTVYAETCASIALMLFADRMGRIDADASYSDVIERIIYNILPAAMQRDGRRFYYTNPLELWPERARRNAIVRHVKPERQRWFSCACCPPNLARAFTSLSRYVLGVRDKSAYLNLFIGCEARINVAGTDVRLDVETNFPQSGEVKINVHPQEALEWELCVREPSWSRSVSVKVNGLPFEGRTEKGYYIISRVWSSGDQVLISLDMTPVLMRANPKVRADAGKVCLMRGPVVYCLEEYDNGENLSALRILPDGQIKEIRAFGLPAETIALRLEGMREIESENDVLYKPYAPSERQVKLTAVPYAVWGNREPGEMSVWIRI